MADAPKPPAPLTCTRCQGSKQGGTTVRPDAKLGKALCGWCWFHTPDPDGRTKRA